MTDINEAFEWAVRVHSPMNGIPGPHVLECSSESAARRRFSWWQEQRPEGKAELLRRRVVTTRHGWEPV